MISYLKGKVLSAVLSDKYGVIELLAGYGVGYEVLVIKQLAGTSLPDDECELFTVMFVREDDQYLCGFATREEREFFKLVTGVSGIGAKTGLAILSEYSIEDLKEIIMDSDAKRLSKVSGLGSKGAQKIILELTGKLDTEMLSSGRRASGGGYGGNPVMGELNDALFSLGYRGAELQNMLEKGSKVMKTNREVAVEKLLESVLRS